MRPVPDEFFVILDVIWDNARFAGDEVKIDEVGSSQIIKFNGGWKLVKDYGAQDVSYTVYDKDDCQGSVLLRDDRVYLKGDQEAIQRFIDWAEQEGWW